MENCDKIEEVSILESDNPNRKRKLDDIPRKPRNQQGRKD